MRTPSYHVTIGGENLATAKTPSIAIYILDNLGSNGDTVSFEGKMLAIKANGSAIRVSDIGKEASENA